MIPLPAMMTIDEAISQKMSKTFSKKLFETTQILGGFAVMIAEEKEF